MGIGKWGGWCYALARRALIEPDRFCDSPVPPVLMTVFSVRNTASQKTEIEMFRGKTAISEALMHGGKEEMPAVLRAIYSLYQNHHLLFREAVCVFVHKLLLSTEQFYQTFQLCYLPRSDYPYN